jgi:hypothetical protein
MRHEIAGHLVDPLAHRLARERHRLADDVGMELLALGDDRRQSRRADGTPKVRASSLRLG